jgi:hypothetical protein
MSLWAFLADISKQASILPVYSKKRADFMLRSVKFDELAM